jgi:hypothetical protein
MNPVKDETDAPDVQLNHENDSNIFDSESPRGRFSRRGFLGQLTTVAGAALAGVWSLTHPKRAKAEPCYCGGPPPPPPPPPNYSTQSEALINNLVAAFNAHNAAQCVSYFNSSYINTANLQTHLQNNFTAFPKVQCTVNSLTVGPYGEYVTLDYDLPGEYQVVVVDDLVEATGVNPTQSDTVSGTQTFYILTGSSIYEMVGTNNAVTVFAAHGATIK